MFHNKGWVEAEPFGWFLVARWTTGTESSVTNVGNPKVAARRIRRFTEVMNKFDLGGVGCTFDVAI